MRQLKIGQSITNRSDSSIGKYLNDISRVTLLEADEEISLSIRIRNGDKAALDKMINTNLRFVVSVAKQYQHQGIGLADLIGEGNVGLIRAATRFDHTKGFKFISFAVWWIRQTIILAISEQKRIVKLPGNQVVGLAKVNRISQKLEQQLERTPTFAEISEQADLSEEKVADMFANGGLSLSLDAAANEESEFTLLDVLANKNSLSPDCDMLRESLTIDVINLVNKLPGREGVIIKYFYGLDGYPQLIMEDIAEAIDLSKERVRQLKCKGIKTLSDMCRNSKLADYFVID